MLKFCSACNNLYTYIHQDGKLVMKCQACGQIDENIQNICIYSDKFIKNSYDIKIDADLCNDSTLPHTQEIPCLNPECPSNKDPDILPDIVFFHYNKDMKLAYICCLPGCRTYWKN